MNAAMYAMSFVGLASTGAGAIFVGNGKIIGIDVGNLRYNGTYTEQGGRMKGTVAMYAPTAGTLVNGVAVPAGSRWNLTLDWPFDFADGKPQLITMDGTPVQVAFEKIGDV